MGYGRARRPASGLGGMAAWALLVRPELATGGADPLRTNVPVAARRLELSCKLFICPLVFVFEFPILLKQVKGWRLWIADGWAPRCPTEQPRLMGRTEETRARGPKCGEQGKRQGIRSDVREESVRLKKLDPVFEPLHKRTGASPSSHRSISQTPAFKSYPFGLPPDAKAAAFRRAG